MKRENNLAFIDGQNLHLGTTQNNWKVDLNKFRIYLKDKYNITEAYYFLGYVSEVEQDLYHNLQKSGFIILFKEHNPALKGKKKGNVDTDLVFEIMKNLIENKDFKKIVLVSGDGDYKKVVDYLIKKNRFTKILFPNKKFASSLYKSLGAEFYDYLDNIRTYIEWHKKKRAPKAQAPFGSLFVLIYIVLYSSNNESQMKYNDNFYSPFSPFCEGGPEGIVIQLYQINTKVK